MEELCAYYRQYWPEKPTKSKSKKSLVQDGYTCQDDSSTSAAAEGGSPDGVSPEDDEDLADQFGELDDVGLAEALGVPTSTIKKMTPRKEPQSTPANPILGDDKSCTTSTVLLAQQREARMEQLRCLVQNLKFLWLPFS